MPSKSSNNRLSSVLSDIDHNHSNWGEPERAPHRRESCARTSVRDCCIQFVRLSSQNRSSLNAMASSIKLTETWVQFPWPSP